MRKFGPRLKQLRVPAGLTQDGLGHRVGLSQGHVSKIETGTASLPTDDLPNLLPALAEALGVTLWTLVGGTEYAEYDSDCLVAVSGSEGIRRLAYFASALTSLSAEQKTVLFEEAATVREVCEAHHTFLYEPSHYTDPDLHPELSPERVYEIDRAQVSASHLMILHAGHASFGAGQELEIAGNAGIPVLLLMGKNVRISRMVLGSFARTTPIAFSTVQDLRAQLGHALDVTFNALVARAEPPASDIGSRIKERRNKLGLQHSVIAQATGLSEAAIADLEKDSTDHLTNPSLTTIRRLAKVLDTTASYLIDGIVPRPEDTNPILAQSRESLYDFAAAAGLSHTETQELWSNLVLEFRTTRRSVAEARTIPLTTEDWLQRKVGSPIKRQLNLGIEED
jgi:transcriptional regulator with XRE-family HTH domain